VAAYEAAVAYSLEREQFGKPIAGYQLTQFRLAKMLADVTAMRLICMRLASLIDEGALTPAMASLAKMNNAARAREVVADARDLLGGNGILLENEVGRHLGDIEVVQDQREDGADLFRFDMGVHVGELTYDGDTSWTDFAWDSEVRNVDRAAYIALVDELGRAADPNASPEEFGLQMAQTLGASMQSFLARSPQIVFKRVGVTGPSGSFDAALVVGFDGEGSFELSPPDMIARVSAQANARIPKPMLEQILAQTAMVSARSVAEQYPDATEEQIAQVSEQIRQGQQQQLEASGLLAADGDDYTLDASFAGGSLVVNGVSMNGLLGH